MLVNCCIYSTFTSYICLIKSTTMNFLDVTTIGPDDNLNPPEPQKPIEPTAEAEARAEAFWNERGMSEMLFKRFPVEVREPKDAKEFLFGIDL